MGSYNTKCFVSQQVITSNNPVYLFPIKQGSSYQPVDMVFSKNKKQVSQYSFTASSSHPTDFWEIAGPMIHAVYDDCGNFIPVDTVDNLANLHSFFTSLYKGSATVFEDGQVYFNIREKFNPQKTYSFDELVDIWDATWQVVLENKIFSQNYNNAVVPMSCAVMHKATGDYFIKKISEANSYWGNSWEQSTYFQSYVNDQINHIFKLFPEDALEKNIHFCANKISQLDGFNMGRFQGCHTTMLYDWPTDPIEKIIQTWFAQNPQNYNLGLDTTNQILKLVQEHVNLLYILQGMLGLNTMFSPIAYSGQDDSNDTGDQFMELVMAVNAELNNQKD